MRLYLLHPEYALLSCHDCTTYMTANGQIIERWGKRQLRPAGAPTPCDICPKIPHGKAPCPGNAQELDARGWAAYQHYLRCKAVNWQNVAKDEFVEAVAGAIYQVEQQCERHERKMERIQMERALLVSMNAGSARIPLKMARRR